MSGMCMHSCYCSFPGVLTGKPLQGVELGATTYCRALVNDFGVVHQQGVNLHLSVVNHGQVLQQPSACALVLQGSKR
jgi:hypothetical protein